MKIFPIKLTINLKGINQGFYMKDSEDKIELERFNKNGTRSTVFKLEKSAWGMLKLWFRQNRRWGIACCSLLVLGCISFYTVKTISTPFEDRLYNRYYAKMGDKIMDFFVKDNAFNEAKRQYLKGEGNTALIILNGLPDNRSIRVEKILYQALSLMETDRHVEAITKFEQIVGNDSYAYVFPVSYWYLSLCYIKTGELDKAELFLNRLNRRNFIDYKKAERLLKRVRKENS